MKRAASEARTAHDHVVKEALLGLADDEREESLAPQHIPRVVCLAQHDARLALALPQLDAALALVDDDGPALERRRAALSADNTGAAAQGAAGVAVAVSSTTGVGSDLRLDNHARRAHGEQRHHRRRRPVISVIARHRPHARAVLVRVLGQVLQKPKRPPSVTHTGLISIEVRGWSIRLPFQ